MSPFQRRKLLDLLLLTEQMIDRGDGPCGHLVLIRNLAQAILADDINGKEEGLEQLTEEGPRGG